MITPTLKTLLGNYPNSRALREGTLRPETFGFEFADVKVPNRAFKRAVRDLEFDIAELALVTFFQAKAYGKPLSLIPAVVGAGRYQHHCLVHDAERGPLRVAQLAGKRIGIRALAQTTVTWVRGVLAEDYGVPLDKVQWVTFEDGHLAEFPDPPGVERTPEGRTMVDMLLAGELDAAIIGTDLPDNPRLQPVLPDPHEAAHAWGARLQLVPINHMVAVKTELLRERPEIVRELYTMLQQSKTLGTAVALPGRDLTPFGIGANRGSLQVLLRYSYEQGLLPRPFTVDELFEDFLQATQDRRQP
ncbi:MAG TPA: phosphate ABC transporter substrate-binding protein [Ramlibacter sp.]|nr:phosphate ABC transporter substrate-binding protein [Ramlibacter sp.]